MSLRREMLQVARLSPRALGESADLVAKFFRAQQQSDGGFADRTGVSDLYYTVFGLDGLVALHQDLPIDRITPYLQSFGDGAGLDFVHLACLARAYACLRRPGPSDTIVDPSSTNKLIEGPGFSRGILQKIEQFRSADGGYNATPKAPHGTAYGVFLALGAYQDLQALPPDAERLLQSIESLRARDGGYGNQPGMPLGQTSATAAAIAVHRQLGDVRNQSLGDWLLKQFHPQGGFIAAAGAPLPDLLSTATALHALATLQRPIDHIRDQCLDFIDTLWTNRGGFYGSWADDHLDCEYTYYGLLALGHLSV